MTAPVVVLGGLVLVGLVVVVVAFLDPDIVNEHPVGTTKRTRP